MNANEIAIAFVGIGCWLAILGVAGWKAAQYMGWL